MIRLIVNIILGIILFVILLPFVIVIIMVFRFRAVLEKIKTIFKHNIQLPSTYG